MAASYQDNPIIQTCSIFDEATKDLFCDLEIISRSYKFTKESLDNAVLPDNPVISMVQHREDESFKSGMTCSLCQVVFETLDNQRDHFKMDWHRFNLKQKMMGKPCVSEDAFEETSGDMSSLSGSDTETDDDLSLESSRNHFSVPGFSNDDAGDEKAVGRNHPKIFLTNRDGKVFSMFQTIIYSVKNIPQTQEDLVAMVTNTPKEKSWIVLMTAGGHFAGAVFSGSVIVCHKTFHRYTVRAKRGTSQGARDNQQGGKQPKSAGASLRRYNEAALLQNVQDLLESWSAHIENADRIFIRTPSYNKLMFFGAKKPPFKKEDPRLRTIPFATRRPTFNEIKRVHAQLSVVEILGNKEDVLQSVVNRLQNVQTTSKASASRNEVPQETREDNSSSDAHICTSPHSTIIDGKQEDLSNGVERTSSGNASPIKTKKKGGGKKMNKEEKRLLQVPSPADIATPEQHLWNRLYCACVAGNIDILWEFLSRAPKEGRKSDATACRFQPGGTNSEVASDEKITDVVDGRTKYENTNSTNDTERTQSPFEQEIEFNSKSVSKIYNVSSENREESVEEVGFGLQLLNEKLGESGSTLLHAASRATQTNIVHLLLCNGGDPAVRDERGKTPYNVAGDKQTRNEFRRFMALHPSRYDYKLAQIPSPLTAEAEEEQERKTNEKKKVQRKAKKERQKEQKLVARKKEEEEVKKREEENERLKFMALSEREKRALAAERRFAQQQALKSEGLSCSYCSKNLAGLVPFDRLSYKYCSTSCVQGHRKALESESKTQR